MKHYANILVKKAKENNPDDIIQEIKNLVLSMNFANGTQECNFLTLCCNTI